MSTFDSWWAEQPIAKLPDTERVAYLRDMAQQVWVSAQQAERDEWTKTTAGVTTEVSSEQRAVIMRRILSLLTYGELLIRAQGVFIENTKQELEQYSFQTLVRIIKLEEEDRKHGVRPTYRIDDVCLEPEWRS